MNNEIQRNIKLIVSYDGGRYHGFQRQKNAVSIQAILEEKLAFVFGDDIKIVASGRTDAGVHALGQVINFATRGTIPIERVTIALNSLLPDDIVIKFAEEVDENFHARYSAKSKIYLYHIQQGQVLNPFQRHYAWHIKQPLDIEAMRQSMAYIVGTHDFSAFQAVGSVKMNPVRTIYQANCQLNGEILEFSFWGNGFLYHMVRNLVGTLVNTGRRKMTPEHFQQVLLSRNRRNAGMTAPARGLYLKQVIYE